MYFGMGCNSSTVPATVSRKRDKSDTKCVNLLPIERANSSIITMIIMVCSVLGLAIASEITHCKYQQ